MRDGRFTEWLAQRSGCGWAQCRSPGEGENLSECLVSKHFVLIDGLVISEAKRALVTGEQEHL